MKKWKMSISILLCALFVLAGTAGAVKAEEGSVSVSVRIEGAAQLLYDETLTVSAAEGALRALELFQYLDEQSEEITFVGLADGYISAVNDETAGRFGGWDGWIFRVNGLDADVGIASYVIADGDEVVLYYGDPFGVGMQYPEFSYADGVLTVTSKDTAYDENWNPVVTENPIADAIVTVEETRYVTDAEGKITLKEEQQAAGSYALQIEKTSEEGLPLVLRLAPESQLTIVAEQDAAPKAGEKGSWVLVAGLAAVALAGLFVQQMKRREQNAAW